MIKHTFLLTLLFLLALTFVVRVTTKSYAQPAVPAPSPQPCTIPFPLPNATGIGTAKFEKLLYTFLDQGCYKTWISDRQIRNSGPFINNQSFGTHNSVKVSTRLRFGIGSNTRTARRDS